MTALIQMLYLNTLLFQKNNPKQLSSFFVLWNKKPARLITHESVPGFIFNSFQPIFVTVSMVKY